LDIEKLHEKVEEYFNNWRRSFPLWKPSRNVIERVRETFFEWVYEYLDENGFI